MPAKETDPAKRTQMYADADKMLVVDEAVIAPLYWYASPSIYQKNIVHPKSITEYDYYEFWIFRSKLNPHPASP